MRGAQPRPMGRQPQLGGFVRNQSRIPADSARPRQKRAVAPDESLNPDVAHWVATATGTGAFRHNRERHHGDTLSGMVIFDRYSLPLETARVGPGEPLSL